MATKRICLTLVSLAVFAIGCGGQGSASGEGKGFVAGKSIDEVFVGDGDRSVRLSWSAPEWREDGEPIDTELAYKIHLQGDVQEPQTIFVGIVSNVVVHGLSSSTYSFSVSAVDPQGMESEPSEVLSVPVS